MQSTRQLQLRSFRSRREQAGKRAERGIREPRRFLGGVKMWLRKEKRFRIQMRRPHDWSFSAGRPIGRPSAHRRRARLGRDAHLNARQPAAFHPPTTIRGKQRPPRALHQRRRLPQPFAIPLAQHEAAEECIFGAALPAGCDSAHTASSVAASARADAGLLFHVLQQWAREPGLCARFNAGQPARQAERHPDRAGGRDVVGRAAASRPRFSDARIARDDPRAARPVAARREPARPRRKAAGNDRIPRLHGGRQPKGSHVDGETRRRPHCGRIGPR